MKKIQDTIIDRIVKEKEGRLDGANGEECLFRWINGFVQVHSSTNENETHFLNLLGPIYHIRRFCSKIEHTPHFTCSLAGQKNGRARCEMGIARNL